MIHVDLNETSGIAILYPDGPLTKHDFKTVSGVIDPYLEKSNTLKGLIINTETFPGWESFAALVTHLRFIKGHHKKISRIALVTDSRLADFSEKIAGHFISAEIKHFKFGELDAAKSWISILNLNK